MAVSLAFGVVFATFITLILVPTTYLILNDFMGGLRWMVRGDPVGTLPPSERPVPTPADAVAVEPSLT